MWVKVSMRVRVSINVRLRARGVQHAEHSANDGRGRQVGKRLGGDLVSP